jgi:predicted enzyme related to lactoylglutathione lyase
MFRDTPAFSGFAVDDIDKAAEFYADTLGLDVSSDEMGFITLHLAGERAVMVYPKPDFVPATYTILNFEVEDAGAAVDELTSRGVEFERYEEFEQDEKGIFRGLAAGEGPDIAWFTDPAGNIIAVMQTS